MPCQPYQLDITGQWAKPPSNYIVPKKGMPNNEPRTMRIVASWGYMINDNNGD